MTTVDVAANAVANGADDMNFLESMAGDGLENMDVNTTSISYLSLVQPDSSAESEENPAGTWRNTTTNKNYGNEVKVIPLAFRTIWNERESEPPFTTVGRYPVGGIHVETRQPSKGKKGYPKMINPDTGNEVQELFVYAVILPDYPEDGVLYFNPTVGSMRACKAWNRQLKSCLLSNGAQAPIFGFQWYLRSELTQNPQQPSKQVTRFVQAYRDSITTKELFIDLVQPQLAITKQNVLQLTENISEEEVDE